MPCSSSFLLSVVFALAPVLLFFSLNIGTASCTCEDSRKKIEQVSEPSSSTSKPDASVQRKKLPEECAEWDYAVKKAFVWRNGEKVLIGT